MSEQAIPGTILLADLRLAWEDMASHLFCRVGRRRVWAAPFLCDVSVLALMSMATPGFNAEAGAEGLRIHAFDCVHLIPWAQIDPSSLPDMHRLLSSIANQAMQGARAIATVRFPDLHEPVEGLTDVAITIH